MTVRVNQRQRIRRGRVFDVTVENVTLPNGFNLELEIIRHPGASAIVPFNSDNEVLLLKQFRHAVGGFVWEIPAGTFDGQEDPLTCAQRELAEETGYSAQQWDSLGAITPVPGYSDERVHLFLARDLYRVSQHLDQDEIIEVHLMPLDGVMEMITSGQIEDAKTISAIFLSLQKINGHPYGKSTHRRGQTDIKSENV